MSYSIITISRQYGSGRPGESGTQLAERLGTPFTIEPSVRRPPNAAGSTRRFWSWRSGGRAASWPISFSFPAPPSAFLWTIRPFWPWRPPSGAGGAGTLHSGGRGANRILSDRKDALHVYLYADRQTRLKRIVEQYGVPAQQAEKVLRDTDRARAVYLKEYTDQVMGHSENYHLCLDSGALGIEHTVRILEAVYRIA